MQRRRVSALWRWLLLACLGCLVASGCLPFERGAPLPEGRVPLEVHLGAEAPVAVRVIDFTYDRSIIPSHVTGSFVLELPGLDDRVRMLALDAAGTRLAHLPDPGQAALWVSPEGCAPPEPVCRVEVRLVFELVDMSTAIDLSGSIRWGFACIPDCNASYSPPPSANPVTIEVKAEDPRSGAPAVAAASVEANEVTLSPEAPLAVYDLKLHVPPLSKPADPATVIAALLELRAEGFDVTDPENASVVAHLRKDDPPRETTGFGRGADGSLALPLTSCEWDAPCDRDYQVTFRWRGPAPTVTFNWQIEAQVRSYGAPLGDQASDLQLTLTRTALLRDEAPRVRGSIAGSFDVPEGHRWWRGVRFSWTAEPAAIIASGDPFLPVLGTLSLRATPTAGPTDATVRVHIQGAGWVDLPLNGDAVTVGWAPDGEPWCRGCSKDAFLLFARLDPGAPGTDLHIEWTATVEVASFAEGSFPPNATLSLECRDDCRAEDIATQ